MSELNIFEDNNDPKKEEKVKKKDKLINKMIYIMSFGEMIIQYDFCLNQYQDQKNTEKDAVIDFSQKTDEPNKER